MLAEKQSQEVTMGAPAERDSMVLSSALGDAVAGIWSSMPHDVQRRLFEEVVSRRGEAIKESLATYLHEKHQRTHDGLKARAILEPDSLGG
jgi:hypothetical protein